MAKYTVKAGDSFSRIADKMYGDQRLFNLVAKAAKGVKVLQPGMVLKLPSRENIRNYQARNKRQGRRHYVGPDDVAQANISTRLSGSDAPDIEFAEGTAPSPYYQYVLGNLGGATSGGTASAVGDAPSVSVVEPREPSGQRDVAGGVTTRGQIGGGGGGVNTASAMARQYIPSTRPNIPVTSYAPPRRGAVTQVGYGLDARTRRALANASTDDGSRYNPNRMSFSDRIQQDFRNTNPNFPQFTDGSGPGAPPQGAYDPLSGQSVYDFLAGQPSPRIQRPYNPTIPAHLRRYATTGLGVTGAPETVRMPDGSYQRRQGEPTYQSDSRGDRRPLREGPITGLGEAGTYDASFRQDYERDRYGNFIVVIDGHRFTVPSLALDPLKNPGPYYAMLRDVLRARGKREVNSEYPGGIGNYAPYEYRNYGGGGGGGGYTPPRSRIRAITPQGVRVGSARSPYAGGRSGGGVYNQNRPRPRQAVERAYESFIGAVSWRLF